MEELAEMVDFDVAIHAEEKQTSWVAKLGHAPIVKGGPQPLKRHNGSHWVENLARQAPDNAVSVPCSKQYRYGHSTIRFIKEVFPDLFGKLECPEKFQETFVIPYIFADLKECGDWVFDASEEVLRSNTVFTSCLAVIAVEMVLAHSRGCSRGSCQILVMWCLTRPLSQLMSFVDAFCVDACREVHRCWQIPEPAEGYVQAYSYSFWTQSDRMQFKAGQNAHSSDADVSLWFLVRRQKGDLGLRGEQTFQAFLFEQMSRAKLRQHVFMEDLMAEEVGWGGDFLEELLVGDGPGLDW